MALSSQVIAWERDGASIRIEHCQLIAWGWSGAAIRIEHCPVIEGEWDGAVVCIEQAWVVWVLAHIHSGEVKVDLLGSSHSYL